MTDSQTLLFNYLHIRFPQTGPFTLFGISICYKKEAWELLIYYSKLRHRQTPIGQIINNSPRLITYTIRQYI